MAIQLSGGYSKKQQLLPPLWSCLGIMNMKDDQNEVIESAATGLVSYHTILSYGD